MKKHPKSRKRSRHGSGGPKQESERKKRMRQRMAASAMASPEELAAVLGITLNQAYGVLKHRKVRAMRLKQRWLIPRTEIERLKNGDVSEILGGPVLHLIGDAPAPTSP